MKCIRGMRSVLYAAAALASGILLTGWFAPPAQAEEEGKLFTERGCPFTFRLPDSARPEHLEVTVEGMPDGMGNVSARWQMIGFNILLTCTPDKGLKIPEHFLEGVCNSKNPWLTEGSYCGSAKAYEGVEYYYLMPQSGSDISYRWLYGGMKDGQGRISLSIGTGGKNKPDTELIEAVTSTAKMLYGTVR